MKMTIIGTGLLGILLSIGYGGVALADLDHNPPGPRGGPGTNWENPPGWRGGPGASPDRRRWGNPPGPVGGPGRGPYWSN